MKIRYMGAFDGNEQSLPAPEHKPGAVAFREADMQRLALIANGLAILIIVALGLPLFFTDWYHFTSIPSLLGMAAGIVCSVPHEYLHALCFRKEAFIYTNLSQGMLFVTGPEDMSKGRFVFMSLLPSVVFGLVPCLLGWWLHSSFFASLGVLSLGMGAGDYYNVFNALTQMPAGARTGQRRRRAALAFCNREQHHFNIYVSLNCS